MILPDIENLKYPIGQYDPPEIINRALVEEWIYDLSIFPESLQRRLQKLSLQDLEKTYRPGGWTVAQVVHHCADSHMNSFIRFKLGLSEDNPTVKPYIQEAWAMMADVQDVPASVSLQLLKALHIRMVALFKKLDEKQLARTIFHPEHNKTFTLAYMLGMYSWHCRHHLAHIDLALND